MSPRPLISPEKRRERYLEAVRDKMVKLYAFGEAKPPAREQLWHEITGFLEAGEMIKIVKQALLYEVVGFVSGQSMTTIRQ
ncbi:MAG: hypothetical protein P8N63_01040 [Pseudomonadales bacterium]|nr:hypothetical protein [Pseudomonadales bacterium]